MQSDCRLKRIQSYDVAGCYSIPLFVAPPPWSLRTILVCACAIKYNLWPFTFREHMTAGMDITRVKGEKMPHKMAVVSDRVMKSFGVYSYLGG